MPSQQRQRRNEHKGATLGCSGEGAMTSSYDTLYVRIHGVHRTVSMKCPLQVPIANVRVENARESRAFSDWSQEPISNVSFKNAGGSRAFSDCSEVVVAQCK